MALSSVSNVGFNDYTADQADIDRRRQYAQALTNQSQTPMETQTAGGWVLPNSPTQGLAKMLQAYSGRKGQEAATEQQKQLGQTYQSDLANTLMRAQQAGQGTPARTIQPDPQEAQQSADQGTPQVGAVSQPAVAGDKQAMARILMGHPASQQLGLMQAQKDMDEQSRQASLEKIMGITKGQGQAGGSNAFAGLPPQVVALMTSGDPELVKLGTTLMEANKGIAQRPGAPVVNPFTGQVIAQPTPAVPAGVGLQVGPGGPQAYPVPGAQGAMGSLAASQAGATEAGKAPYQLQTVNTQGSPTLMTHQQAIEQATGQPMPQPGQPQGQQPPNQPMGTVAPPRPGTPEYQAYSQVKSGQVPTAYVPQQPQPRGMRLQDQGEQRAQVEMGEGLGKRYNSIQDAGFSANQKMQKFDRLNGLLGQIDAGKLTPAGTELSAWAKAAGFPIGEGVDNAQAAKAMSNEMALELRNPSGGAGMPGAMSDSDRNYLQSLIASIDKTPGANKLLIEGMQKLAQRDREVAQLARDYKKKNGSFDDGFYDELGKFSDSNPLFKSAPKETPNVQAIVDELRRRGHVQ